MKSWFLYKIYIFVRKLWQQAFNYSHCHKNWEQPVENREHGTKLMTLKLWWSPVYTMPKEHWKWAKFIIFKNNRYSSVKEREKVVVWVLFWHSIYICTTNYSLFLNNYILCNILCLSVVDYKVLCLCIAGVFDFTQSYSQIRLWVIQFMSMLIYYLIVPTKCV